MGQTCTRDASMAFDHFCHQMNRNKGTETPNQLDTQLAAADSTEMFTKIKRLAEEEIKFNSEVLKIYGRAYKNGGLVNSADLKSHGQNFIAFLQRTLRFDNDVPTVDTIPEPKTIHKSQLELDGMGLNSAWSLALAQLTLECCLGASTFAEAITAYQAKNTSDTPLRRVAQAKALELLPWTPDQGSVSIWLRDSF
jgi:hypothetical protein